MKASRINPPTLAGPREWVASCMRARGLGPTEFLRTAGLSDNFLWHYNDHVQTASLVRAVMALQKASPLSESERESLLATLGVGA